MNDLRMHSKRKNRWLAVLLTVMLIIQGIPLSVFADEMGGQKENRSGEQTVSLGAGREASDDAERATSSSAGKATSSSADLEEGIPVEVEEDGFVRILDGAVIDGRGQESIDAGEPAAFSQSKTVNGVAVTVEADEGVFPEDAVLSVTAVPASMADRAEAAVGSVRDAEVNVAVSYTFDIKVIDPATGEELQPAEEEEVSVSFDLAEAEDENLDTAVYHVTGETGQLTAELLPAAEGPDRSVTVMTGGFSLYTVEFTYNKLTYVLPGDGSTALSDILDQIGLEGDAEAVSVSDPELFSASDETGEWVVTAHKAFGTKEWMKVTIAGIEYEITVTDSPKGTQEPIPYIDDKGSDMDPVSDYVRLENVSYDSLSLDGNAFYVVIGSVTVDGQATVNGQPTIILCDDAELKCEGLIVSGGNTINIYCQAGKSGKLTSNADRKPGIGGLPKGETGTINIYGGIITAASTSGSLTITECAGIGSGDSGKGGTVNIYGGTVTATGDKYAAGIGSGDEAESPCNVNIYGGIVNATGGDEAAGIGGGNNGYGGYIRIQGGEVTAIAKKYGAGIGGGDKGFGGHIDISGGTVTATGGEGGAGIGSGDNDKTANTDSGFPAWITISGGTVTATGGEHGAGIGGGNQFQSGIITIKGGEKITAIGGNEAAGIGGGYLKGGDTIRIEGEVTVEATGGGSGGTESEGGAGIGGGAEGAGGIIQIYGGNITATGGKGGAVFGAGAGIGGGNLKGGGDITITGGTIAAKGGSNDGSPHDGGAGIGGGNDGAGGTIKILGNAKIEATGGKGGGISDSLTGSGGAGIGGGDSGNSGTILISESPEIEAYGGSSFGGGGAGIGGGDGGGVGVIKISGGKIKAYGGGAESNSSEAQGTFTKGGAGIGGGAGAGGGSITISLENENDSVYAYGANEGAAVGGGNNADHGSLTLGDVTEVFKLEFGLYGGGLNDVVETVSSKSRRVDTCRGKGAKLVLCPHDIIKYIDLGDAGHQRICRYCYVERADEKTPQPHVPDEAGVCKLCGLKDEEGVRYIDENGEGKVCKDYLIFDAENAAADGLAADKWYVVKELENDVASRIAVKGDVHLIICDGCDLTAKMGIEVPSGTSLTIYGQGGKAYLEAYGSGSNAGIGGSTGNDSGPISISDIIVEVTGGEGAAGIGAGKGRKYESIALYRNTVKATGGKGGAGIGGGASENENSENTGRISIVEGTARVTGGLGAAGIGGGKNQKGGTITVDGVEGGNLIDVYDPDIATIQAFAGKNDAASGGAAAIGGGEFGDGGEITINGGLILAMGGDNTSRLFTTSGGGGAGIGGGAGAAGVEITINAGVIDVYGGTAAVIEFHDGGGAGIGGGDNGSAGTITITGGTVHSVGGYAQYSQNQGGAAGIGGGDNGSGGSISILGGMIEAKSRSSKSQAFGRGNGGTEGTIDLYDGACVYMGFIGGAYNSEECFKADSRVDGCRTKGTTISIIPCQHPDASYQIEDPANKGHYVACQYCKVNPMETQPHKLDEQAVCVCGYHGVILSFNANGGSGTMEPAVLPGGTKYALPEPGFSAPDNHVFAGWSIDGRTYGAGKEYETPVTRDETVSLEAAAQWTEVPAGHTHSLSLVAEKKATCTEAGNTAYYTCSGCDQWFEDTDGTREIKDKNSVVTDALGHDWGAWTQTKAPTVTAEGEETRTCSRCKEKETRSVPKVPEEPEIPEEPAGHTHSLSLVAEKKATCTEAGNTAYYTCSGCDRWFEDADGTREIKDKNSVVTDALGHDWGAWIQTKAPTVTAEGEETRTCSRCKEKETRSVPRLDAVTYTVAFNANSHGTPPAAQLVESGKMASEPAAPTAVGYTFGGWYKEAACRRKFSFRSAVTGDITLYAKWTENRSGGDETSDNDSTDDIPQRSIFAGHESDDSNVGYWMPALDGWHYVKSDGMQAVGWNYIWCKGRNDWYYFDERGVMQTGWIVWKGRKFYLNPVSNGWKGAMFTGWHQIDGRWYYFEPAAGKDQGHLYVDAVTPDGYRTGEDGAWRESNKGN